MNKVLDKLIEKTIELAKEIGRFEHEIKDWDIAFSSKEEELKKACALLEKETLKNEEFVKAAETLNKNLQDLSSKEYKRTVYENHLSSFIKELYYNKVITDNNYPALLRSTKTVLGIDLTAAEIFLKKIKADLTAHFFSSYKEPSLIDPISSALNVLSYLHSKKYLTAITRNDILGAIKAAGNSTEEAINKATNEAASKLISSIKSESLPQLPATNIDSVNTTTTTATTTTIGELQKHKAEERETSSTKKESNVLPIKRDKGKKSNEDPKLN